MSWKRSALEAAYRTGAVRLGGRYFGRRRLTVLAYHRVVDQTAEGFDTYRRNVSATPEAFDRQMRLVAARFHPVALSDVVNWLDGGSRLPLRPLLVTFDDGYRDNLDHALPILERYDIPAAVFLATDHIGTGLPFGWDLAAWCFAHTDLTSAPLPLLGRQSWSREEGETVLDTMVERLKRVPERTRAAAVGALAEILEVDPPAEGFRRVYLDWEDVRVMHRRGVAFGAHTRTHPILTRVEDARRHEEIVGSKDRIEKELGEPVLGFAYPNGQRADIDARVTEMVSQAGFRLGFTLIPGPARHREVRADPLMVRRIYVHHKDGAARFAAKICGWSRIGPVVR